MLQEQTRTSKYVRPSHEKQNEALIVYNTILLHAILANYRDMPPQSSERVAGNWKKNVMAQCSFQNLEENVLLFERLGKNVSTAEVTKYPE